MDDMQALTLKAYLLRAAMYTFHTATHECRIHIKFNTLDENLN